LMVSSPHSAKVAEKPGGAMPPGFESPPFPDYPGSSTLSLS
jgi:hypothetical protein